MQNKSGKIAACSGSLQQHQAQNYVTFAEDLHQNPAKKGQRDVRKIAHVTR